jgi:hypothetical protein
VVGRSVAVDLGLGAREQDVLLKKDYLRIEYAAGQPLAEAAVAGRLPPRYPDALVADCGAKAASLAHFTCFVYVDVLECGPFCEAQSLPQGVNAQLCQ